MRVLMIDFDVQSTCKGLFCMKTKEPRSIDLTEGDSL